MSEAEESVASLISPDDYYSNEIKSYLRDAGFSASDQDWLVNVFQHPDCYGDQCDLVMFKNLAFGFSGIFLDTLEKSSTPKQAEAARQTRLALILGSLLELGPIYLPTATSKNPEWINKFHRHAAFCAKNLDWRQLTELETHWFKPLKLLPHLFPKGVPLEDFVNLDFDSDTFDNLSSYLAPDGVNLAQIIHIALTTSGPRREWSIKDFRHPEGFEHLIRNFRSYKPHSVADDKRENLDALLKVFSRFPEDILPAKVLSLLNVIEYVYGITSERQYLWFSFKDQLSSLLKLLDDKQPELNLCQTSLLKAWWRVSMAVHLGGYKLSDDQKNRLVQSAVEHFGILQKVLKDAPEDFKDNDLTGVPNSDFYDTACNILCSFASPWLQLQSLLTVFTEMSTPAIPYDLSCLLEWPNVERKCPPNTNLLSLRTLLKDENESPLQPYCKIPMWFEDTVMRIWREDGEPQKNGADWYELREEFAKFCLERLETERRSLWRQGYVQALRVLRVNSRGRTRETLLRLSESDPNEIVRELARYAHKEFGNDVHEEFPGHPLLQAFWFLRQSHRLELRPSRKNPEVHLVKQCLQEAGFSNADWAWLVRLFERPDCFGDPNGLSIFKPGVLDGLPWTQQELQKLVIVEKVQAGKHRQTRLAVIFSFLLGFCPVNSMAVRPNVTLQEEHSNGHSDFPAWVGNFQVHSGFCVQRLDWFILTEIERSHSLQLNHLIPFLFTAPISFERLVDLDLLNPRPKPRTREDFRNPKTLEFWLMRKFRLPPTFHEHLFPLDRLLQEFSSFPEDILGDKILGLLMAVRYSWHRANGKWVSEAVVADELVPFFELLNEKQPEACQDRSSLLRAWWRLSIVTSVESRPRLPQTLLRGEIVESRGIEYALKDKGERAELARSRLVESAARHIGMLRALLRDTPKVFQGDEPVGLVYDYYEDAFKVLLYFGTPWECLRPLLLAFTQMTVPTVPSDLRFWHEPKRDKLPQPYSKIPLWIGMAMYPQNLRAALERDPHLRDLREDFAKFCLARLKTKQSGIASTNENFVEPRPVWRQCYVRALTALRVNPGGRAHKTLFWTTNNDPDEEVRKLAKRAHRQVRHLERGKPNLDVGASPRRPIFEAFWYLRQAHLITLGKEVDPAGAMRTRRKELHRTREEGELWIMDDADYTNRFTTM